jgi:phenylacetate-coenzyme A ligase PaaK-like adenylate-forming protein
MNLYGCMEAPTMAFALDDNQFEVFSNLVFFEYENVSYENNRRSGDIVITNLLNYAMPIIRYRLRDRGRIIGEDDAAAVRFIGPLLGREDDIITLTNGQRFVYHHSYQMFASFAECRQYRFVQLPDGSMRLWLVPTNDTEKGREAARRKALQIWRDKFPDVALEIEFKNSLPLGRTGKHRVIERLEDWPST